MKNVKGHLTARRKAIVPKSFTNSQADFVSIEPLCPELELPMMVRPRLDGVSLSAWATSSRPLIESRLLRHGALLFRGFRLASVDDFESFAAAVSGPLLEYQERSSPRSIVKANVYTSTDYPADKTIFLHNENSYQRSWPMKIHFYCERPPQEGGETPIADCRKVFMQIDQRIIERFLDKKWMYVRNFGNGFGLPWQTVFQTSDKRVVEEHCRRNCIEAEWKEGDRLRLSAVLPAMARHPRTGEMAWFNHATFLHVSTLEKTIRERLTGEFKDGDLPTNTYYGDGSAIEDSVLDQLRAAYNQNKVAFAWRAGDVLLLDNMLVAHGRNPYVGSRRILVAMGEACSRDAAPASTPG